MEEIARGIHIHQGFRGSNVGLVETRDGNIIIDTPMLPSDNAKWLAYIRRVTRKKPNLYIVNTDHHRGHVLGNQFYNAPVIAHELAWKNMRGYGANFCQRVIDSFKREPKIQAEFTNLTIVRPTITFDNRLDIEHGGPTVRLIHVGGHTEATILTWLPESKILFAGDTVWFDQHPYMAQSNSKQWLDALSYIRRLKPAIIVPGHGPLTTADSTTPLSEYIRLVRRQVRTLFNKGYTKQETASALVKGLVPYFPIPQERQSKIEAQIKQGINRVYNENKKAALAAAEAAAKLLPAEPPEPAESPEAKGEPGESGKAPIDSEDAKAGEATTDTP
ncbi:MAG: MBL fold metallo-hydrolase [Chloroflexota bacterium]|nr:MBL fold metallo-hydrolase [Chloroflexota bacterium]